MQRQDIDRQGSAIILARALAKRLQDVVPSGIQVLSRGGDVVVSDGRTSDGTSLVPLVDQPGDVEDNLVTAASAVLNTVQDFATESLRSPWPAAAGKELVLPTALVEGGILRLCFGGPATPVLELEPISLVDLF